jgi:hypothetical protein
MRLKRGVKRNIHNDWTYAVAFLGITGYPMLCFLPAAAWYCARKNRTRLINEVALCQRLRVQIAYVLRILRAVPPTR